MGQPGKNSFKESLDRTRSYHNPILWQYRFTFGPRLVNGSRLADKESFLSHPNHWDVVRKLLHILQCIASKHPDMVAGVRWLYPFV
jgi:hypothetical protein